MTGKRGVFANEEWVSEYDRVGKDQSLLDSLFKPTGMGGYVLTFRVFYEYLVAMSVCDSSDAYEFVRNHMLDHMAYNTIKYVVGETGDIETQRLILSTLWRSVPHTAIVCSRGAGIRREFMKSVVRYDMEEETIIAIRNLAFRLDEIPMVEVVGEFFDPEIRNGYILYTCNEIISTTLKNTTSDIVQLRCQEIISVFLEEAKSLHLPISFVRIPGGVYKIGQNDGVDTDEEPSHDVLLDEFEISRSVVTNEQYKRFDRTFRPDPLSAEDSMPAVNLTWFEASLFCRWAFPTNGRLPTEAEWEASSRGSVGGGQHTQYPWGDAEDTTKANFGRSKKGSTSVYAYPPNQFGLLDAVGNVFQWCGDWYEPGYYKKSPPENPDGPANGRWKVMRGGCWAREREAARCSYRVRQIPATRDVLVGFRICKGRE